MYDFTIVNRRLNFKFIYIEMECWNDGVLEISENLTIILFIIPLIQYSSQLFQTCHYAFILLRMLKLLRYEFIT